MIIGITGTLGAGKGTVVSYLEQKGFRHFSARTLFTEELQKRGSDINRDTMTALANEMRATHGPGFFAEAAVAYAKEHGGDIVAESIRSVGEAEYLQNHDAVLWAVDADREVRYHRIVDRASETDKVTFEEFVAHEERELRSDDPTKQNIAGVMALADHIFHNDSTPGELFLEVEEALKEAQSRA